MINLKKKKEARKNKKKVKKGSCTQVSPTHKISLAEVSSHIIDSKHDKSKEVASISLASIVP